MDWKKYFEIDTDDGYGLAIAAVREPSVEEANEFCKEDCELWDTEVIGVYPISYEELQLFYDTTNEPEWPVFGL